MSKDLDMVVFGATGVTGQYVIRELSKVSADSHLKWAVAGRNAEKLRTCLDSILGEDGQHIPVIVADVENDESLNAMCKQTKIVLNTVGPFRFFGEPVVKACIENGAHHFDVSGEPQFLETIQLKYFDEAKKAGVFVVGSCGWDSIPCELGIAFLKEKFDGDLHAVETYAESKAGKKGISVNVGTWNSIIHGIAHSAELAPLRTELFKKPFFKAIPKSQHALQNKGVLFKSDVAKGWCIPFLGADKSVAKRTQMSNYALYNEKPVYVQTYWKMPSLFSTVVLLFFGMILAVFAKFRLGRSLLEKYPALFSLGVFKEGAPTDEQIREIRFTTLLRGYGWEEKLAEPTDQHPSPPNKQMTVSVTGPDPAYVSTSAFLVQSGLTVLKEPETMPKGGGVFSPGTAFRRSSMIERLKISGIEFSVVE